MNKQMGVSEPPEGQGQTQAGSAATSPLDAASLQLGQRPQGCASKAYVPFGYADYLGADHSWRALTTHSSLQTNISSRRDLRYAALARWGCRERSSWMFTGIHAAGSTVSDSYILMDFIKSREIVDHMSADIDLKQMYSKKESDFWSGFDESRPMKNSWTTGGSMVSVDFDTVPKSWFWKSALHTRRRPKWQTALLLIAKPS